MLKVIDLKTSNISSVEKALRYIGAKFEVIDNYASLRGATKVLLPGVGSFHNSSKQLFKTGFAEELQDIVSTDDVPLLGICVGMQLLADSGVEGGEARGLGLIQGNVKLLDIPDKNLTVPHLGWNSFDEVTDSHKLLDGIPNHSCFYFAHSYEFEVLDPETKVAFSYHGKKISAYIEKNNVYGAQFHPEKSQAEGAVFLRNFVELC
jgi:glutamine amidotransferase